jgi:hypothetical protein
VTMNTTTLEEFLQVSLDTTVLEEMDMVSIDTTAHTTLGEILEGEYRNYCAWRNLHDDYRIYLHLIEPSFSGPGYLQRDEMGFMVAEIHYKKKNPLHFETFPHSEYRHYCTVLDLVSQVRDVVLMKCIFGSGRPRGSGFWNEGYMGKGREMGRSFYEQPGNDVDRILSQQGGFQVSTVKGDEKGSKKEWEKGKQKARGLLYNCSVIYSCTL